MEAHIDFPQVLSGFVQLLQDERATLPERRSALHRLGRVVRSRAAVTLEVVGEELQVDGVRRELAADAFLLMRLRAGGMRGVEVRPAATLKELVLLAHLLATGREAASPAVTAELAGLWNVRITFETGSREGAEEGLGAQVRATVADLRRRMEEVGPERALAELVLLTGRAIAQGDSGTVARMMAGLARFHAEVEGADAMAACDAAMERLLVPSMVQSLARHLPEQADRAELVSVFRLAGDAAVVALFGCLAEAETLEARRAYFDALVQLGTGVPVLVRALEHERWYVVRNAVCLLGELEAHSADLALAQLWNHPHERVREAVAGALARLRTPRALNVLHRLKHDVSPQVRVEAVEALAGSGDAGGIRSLSMLLEEEQDSDVRVRLISALGRMGTPDAVQQLIKYVSKGHHPVEVRIAAVHALAEARGVSVVPLLHTLESDADPALRAVARELAEQLKHDRAQAARSRQGAA